MAEGSGRAVSGLFVRCPLARTGVIGADTNITGPPYATHITAYNNPITLAPGNFDDGIWKKIYNDTGVEITINSTISVQGAATDTITLASRADAFVLLLYLNNSDVSERFRDIDFIGATFS